MELPAPLPLFLAAPSRGALQLALRGAAIAISLFAIVRTLMAYRSPAAMSEHIAAHLAHIDARIDALCYALLHGSAAPLSMDVDARPPGAAEPPGTPEQPLTPPTQHPPRWRGPLQPPAQGRAPQRASRWPLAAPLAGVEAYRQHSRPEGPRTEALPQRRSPLPAPPPRTDLNPSPQAAAAQPSTAAQAAALQPHQPARDHPACDAGSSSQVSRRSERLARRTGEQDSAAQSGVTGMGGHASQSRNRRKRVASEDEAPPVADSGPKTRRRR